MDVNFTFLIIFSYIYNMIEAQLTVQIVAEQIFL